MSTESHTFQQSLREGESKFGLFVMSGSTSLCHSLTYQGYDWILIDAQHSAIDCRSVQELIIACKANPSTHVMVRVGSYADRSGIQFALDSGADGVLIPYINHREELEEAVSCCYYPHHVPENGISLNDPSRLPIKGTRSFGFPLPGMNKLGIKDYLEQSPRNVCVAFQVETEEAIANIDSLVTVPGVDMAFLGPYDQCISMGLYNQHGADKMFHSEHFRENAVRRLSAAVTAQNKRINNKEKDIILGVFVTGTALVPFFHEHGFRYFSLGADIEHMNVTVAARAEEIKQFKPAVPPS